MLLRRLVAIVVLSVTVCSGVAISPGRTLADDDLGGDDELPDIATPSPAPADDRPVSVLAAPEAGTMIFAATVARPDIDDFRYDELVLEGTAAEVCAGRLLPGTRWAFNEVVSRFGGSAGTMYVCRERWDAANDPDCIGTVVNPATNPNFESGCWSNHARGRAWDVMVGRSGSGYNTARGIAIVNWLLAPDSNGNVNANARKLGIQQLLFADRCWNSDGDRGIATWSAMRSCGIGHFDHVHADMTIPGANGTVSFWGATPQVSARIDTQVFWDRNTAWRQAISWFNLRATDEEGLAVPAKYDRMNVGDFDGDGLQDETFLFDFQTGDWVLQNWNAGDSLNARIGRWSRFFDEFIVGDWDADGRVNDMIVWDRQTGNYNVMSWTNYEPRFRASGYISPGYEQILAADLDGNGRVNDTLLWDRDTGKWVSHSWFASRPRYRSTGFWGRGTDAVLVGDFSAGGELDETLLWDKDWGGFVVVHWANFRPVSQRSDRGFGLQYDYGTVGDYDSDGRVDDVFLYDVATGQMAVYSFHRYVSRHRIAQDWMHGFDFIVAGSFLN